MTLRAGVLTEHGPRGGQVGGLDRIVDCQTTARIVVRIRGVFVRQPALRRHQIFDSTLLRAEAPSRVTTIALSTPGGRPIATARIPNGKAFLFTSSNCEED